MESVPMDAQGEGEQEPEGADAHRPIVEYSKRIQATAFHLSIGYAFTGGVMALFTPIWVAVAWYVVAMGTGFTMVRNARWVAEDPAPGRWKVICYHALLVFNASVSSSTVALFFFAPTPGAEFVGLVYACCALMFFALNFAVSWPILMAIASPFILLLTALSTLSMTGVAGTFINAQAFAIGTAGVLLGFMMTARSGIAFNNDLLHALETAETQRQKADDANTRLAHALDETGIGVFDLDLVSKTIYASEFVLLMAGDEKQLRDSVRDPGPYLHPDDIERVRIAMQKLGSGETEFYDETYRTRSKQEAAAGKPFRWVRSRGVGRYRSGRLERFIGCVADVTNEIEMHVKLEDALHAAEDASASKSAFLATMSHEIRTPMNGVLGMAQALAAEDLSPCQREKVDIILESGQSLLGILNDVLDLSKIESGRLTISPIETDLAALADGIVSLWRPSAEEKGLTLDVTLPPQRPIVLGLDPVRVRQCLSNLLSNAIKFTDRGSIRLEVAVDPLVDGHYPVTMRVHDTGQGIPEEDRDKLFEPFTQADATITRESGGTGLGLSITRRLARLMDGNLTVDSTPGAGSIFILNFFAERVAHAPCPQDPTAEDRARALEKEEPKGLHILLVDDNAINRQVARLFLEPAGDHIVDAAHGQEALEKVGEESFDLVLLDMHMPVLDGPETLRRLRDLPGPTGAVPVIALTADAMSGDRERYLALGADGYVSKPIDFNELRSEVTRVMTAARSHPAPAAAPSV